MSNRRLYGYAHNELRKSWTPLVATGAVNCWRCGQPIQPGTAWDLGHRTPPTPSHPEHPTCNRRAGAQYGNRKREPRSSGWGD